MIEAVTAYDQRQRTVILGSCAFLPVQRLLPVLKDCFGQVTIFSNTASDGVLIDGLRAHRCHLAVLHHLPEEKDIFYCPFLKEQLAVTLPENHFLASKETLSFHDLEGLSILAHGGSGFWIQLCKEHLEKTKLLIQDSMDTLSEIVDASLLPVFNSDLAAGPQDTSGGRVTIPIADTAAQITYYLSCLVSEKDKYKQLFHAVCLKDVSDHSCD